MLVWAGSVAEGLLAVEGGVAVQPGLMVLTPVVGTDKETKLGSVHETESITIRTIRMSFCIFHRFPHEMNRGAAVHCS